jgi:hypothetical protein
LQIIPCGSRLDGQRALGSQVEGHPVTGGWENPPAGAPIGALSNIRLAGACGLGCPHRRGTTRCPLRPRRSWHPSPSGPELWGCVIRSPYRSVHVQGPCHQRHPWIHGVGSDVQSTFLFLLFMSFSTSPAWGIAGKSVPWPGPTPMTGGAIGRCCHERSCTTLAWIVVPTTPSDRSWPPRDRR